MDKIRDSMVWCICDTIIGIFNIEQMRYCFIELFGDNKLYSLDKKPTFSLSQNTNICNGKNWYIYVFKYSGKPTTYEVNWKS